MSFTFIAAASQSPGSGSDSTLVFTAPFTVQAGDLIVAIVGNIESGNTGAIAVSDGTSTFNSDHSPLGYTGESELAFRYLLSSVATGAVNYTVTYAGSRAYRVGVLLQVRPSAPCAFVGSVVGGATSGTPNLSSGNKTIPTGDVLCIGGCSTYNVANLTSITPRINAVAADGQANANYVAAWYRAVSTGFTGAATATLSGNDLAATLFGAFEISGGGGTNRRRRVLMAA